MSDPNILTNTTLRGTTNIVGTFSAPAGSVTAAMIAAGANIETSKTVHRHVLNYSQANGASMASATVPIHIVRGTTDAIVSIEVAIMTAAVGNSTVTVDLHRSTAAGAFATALSSVITIDVDTVVRTAEAGTLAATTLADGDVLAIVVIATAGTGTLPQGLIVTVTVDETAA